MIWNRPRKKRLRTDGGSRAVRILAGEPAGSLRAFLLAVRGGPPASAPALRWRTALWLAAEAKAPIGPSG